jgi:hypothetical protein
MTDILSFFTSDCASGFKKKVIFYESEGGYLPTLTRVFYVGGWISPTPLKDRKR